MRDVIAGVSLVVFALFFLIPGLSYGIGTFSRMDTGSYPVALSVILIGIGIVIAIGGVTRGKEQTVGFDLAKARSIFFITASIAAFAMLIERLGLIPATVAVVVLSSLAEEKFRPVITAMLSAIVAFLIWLIFKVGLSLPIDAFEGFD